MFPLNPGQYNCERGAHLFQEPELGSARQRTTYFSLLPDPGSDECWELGGVTSCLGAIGPPSCSAGSCAGGTGQYHDNDETRSDMSDHSCASHVPRTPRVSAYLMTTMICRHVGCVFGVIFLALVFSPGPATCQLYDLKQIPLNALDLSKEAGKNGPCLI